MTSKNRWVCGIEFDGAAYYGWQKQPNLPTVQGKLEQIISKIANHPVSCFAAGRTDKGVHAKELTIHFDTYKNRSACVWQRALNALTPNDINLLWLRQAPLDFHARYSAVARSYEYVICTSKYFQPVKLRHDSWWFPYDFCQHRLSEAAARFLGEHDFSGYRGKHCQAQTPIKTISEVLVQYDANMLVIKITGNSFLHHMVRNIVGSIMFVAQGKRCFNWLDDTFSAKRRVPDIPMVPANGLHFVKAHYGIAEIIT